MFFRVDHLEEVLVKVWDQFELLVVVDALGVVDASFHDNTCILGVLD